MKSNLVIIFSFLIFNVCLSAQNYEPVTVKAGSSVLDYFPFKERYRYPEFVPGIVIFKNGVYSESKFNYNLLMGEMEFIKAPDTLSIINKKDIYLIALEKDTFYYDKGYLELISGGNIKVVLKQYIKLKEIQKKDPYGVSSAGSSRESNSTLPSETNFYKLKANNDLVFQRVVEYYISIPQNGFVPFRKKNVLRIFPPKKKEIKIYLKSNKFNFNSREDLLKLADYLKSL